MGVLGAGNQDPYKPHEWTGDEVDVEIGVVYSPCHACGADRDEAIHRSTNDG